MTTGSIIGVLPSEISALNRPETSVLVIAQPLYSFSSPYFHPGRTGSFYGDFPGRIDEDPTPPPGPAIPTAGQLFPRGYA
jgi:hypothetical protein